jgi:hypothetical protein
MKGLLLVLVGFSLFLAYTSNAADPAAAKPTTATVNTPADTAAAPAVTPAKAEPNKDVRVEKRDMKKGHKVAKHGKIKKNKAEPKEQNTDKK